MIAILVKIGRDWRREFDAGGHKIVRVNEATRRGVMIFGPGDPRAGEEIEFVIASHPEDLVGRTIEGYRVLGKVSDAMKLLAGSRVR